MASTAERKVYEGVDPRTPRPVRRLDLYAMLAGAVLAGVAYVAALLTGAQPPQGLAVALLAIAPVCAGFALLVLLRGPRHPTDPALQWFTTGLAVAFAALVLQLVSHPTVAPGGGLLHTSDQSNAALFLLFHLALAAGAVAGVLGFPAALRRPLTVVGLVVAAMVGINAVPLPHLLDADGRYAPLLVAAQWVVAVLVGGSAVLWAVRFGRLPAALRAWVGVALSLSAYEVALGALGGARYTPLWWASLTFRGATYVLLAVGLVWSVLGQLRDLDAYSNAELDRRESQLGASLARTRQLLRCAEDLARAVTPQEVATVLCADVVAMVGLPRAAVVVPKAGGRLYALGTAGYDASLQQWAQDVDALAALPAARAALTGQSTFLGTGGDIRKEYPDLANTPMAGAAALAGVPLMVRGQPIGALVVWDTKPIRWSPASSELLAGLAAQGGQAVARAQAYEEAAHAASTLQESLLPSRLPERHGLSLAARYVSGEGGRGVSGDWYDCVEVDENQVALVVGDVMGKGLHAAAVMGQMRTTLRALTAIDPSPGVVLAALDRVTQDLDPDEIATVVYVLLDLTARTARLGRAGHPPPLLLTTSGAVRLLDDAGSPPLGVPNQRWGETTVDVPADSLLVLYSDGMVEDRSAGLGPGTSALTRTLRDLAGHGVDDVDVVADALMRRATSIAHDDDMTLLLARVHDDPDDHDVAHTAISVARSEEGPPGAFGSPWV